MADKSDVDKLLSQYPTSDSAYSNGSIVILRKDLIENYTADLADFLITQTRKYKDFGMAVSTMKQLIELKKAYWPATQKQLTANVSDFQKLLNNWKEARMEVEKARAEGKSVISVEYIPSGAKLELDDKELEQYA